MSDVDIAFNTYFNQAQPLFAIQHKTGIQFASAKQIVAVREEIEKAFKEAWRQRDSLAFQ